MPISPNESFILIMGGTAVIFGAFILYGYLHDRKKHPYHHD